MVSYFAEHMRTDACFQNVRKKPIRLLEVVVLRKVFSSISTLKQVDLRQVLPISAHLVEIPVFVF